MKSVTSILIALALPFACVAIVEAPIEVPKLLPCIDDACEQAGYVCGYFSAPIVVDSNEVSPCVPDRCLFGAICEPGCNCGCKGCAEDELCDVQHGNEDMRANGDACVPRSCFVDEQGEFVCGGPPECLDCIN